MRMTVVALCVASALAGGIPARADHQPGFVVPGRPDVPVIINGIDASWGVVEGDWGLYRPGAVPVAVIPALYVPHHRYAPARPYFPSLGGKPYSGRYEIEPPAGRALPRPAQNFHRSWSTASDSIPATQYAPSPEVIMAPPGESPQDQQSQQNSRRKFPRANEPQYRHHNRFRHHQP